MLDMYETIDNSELVWMKDLIVQDLVSLRSVPLK